MFSGRQAFACVYVRVGLRAWWENVKDELEYIGAAGWPKTLSWNFSLSLSSNKISDSFKIQSVAQPNHHIYSSITPLNWIPPTILYTIYLFIYFFSLLRTSAQNLRGQSIVYIYTLKNTHYIAKILYTITNNSPFFLLYTSIKQFQNFNTHTQNKQKKNTATYLNFKCGCE